MESTGWRSIDENLALATILEQAITHESDNDSGLVGSLIVELAAICLGMPEGSVWMVDMAAEIDSYGSGGIPRRQRFCADMQSAQTR